MRHVGMLWFGCLKDFVRPDRVAKIAILSGPIVDKEQSAVSQPFPAYQPPPPPPSFATPTTTSVAAIISLISGILGCLVIPAIVAVITGIIGLRATRDPRVGGRGLAIAGIALGLVFGIGGTACFSAGGIGLYVAYREADKGTDVVDAFLAEVAKGDLDAAMTHIDASYIKPAELAPIAEGIQTLGQPQPFDMSGFNANKNYGDALTIDLAGSVTYPSKTQPMKFVVQKQTDGTYKIIGVDL